MSTHTLTSTSLPCPSPPPNMLAAKLMKFIRIFIIALISCSRTAEKLSRVLLID